MWCLLMTSSIRNLVEAGSTNPETRLITINTRPTASSPPRGRISFQTSGQTAFSRWIFGGFAASLGGELNLLFDSKTPGSASLLLHCHTSRGRAYGCDRACPTVVCSGRVPPVSSGAIANVWPAAGPADYLLCSADLFGVHDLAGHGLKEAANRTGGPQSQRFPAASANPERSQPARRGHA